MERINWAIRIVMYTLYNMKQVINKYLVCSTKLEPGFPCGTTGKESACKYRRCKKHGFNPWVGKIPCRRKWLSALVFLLGKSHGQRSLAAYSPWGRKELDMSEQLSLQFCLMSEAQGQAEDSGYLYINLGSLWVLVLNI